jgi:hypothetical protein
MWNALCDVTALRRHVRELYDKPVIKPIERDEGSAATLIEAILRKKREFGITRLGSITGLDRLGIPVAQVVRPLSLSNAVSQGKGRSIAQAVAAALMESIETFAAERIPASDIDITTANDLGSDIVRLYASTIVTASHPNWSNLLLQWMIGWDLLSDSPVPVPVALVDTVYTVKIACLLPSIRTSIGLLPLRSHSIASRGVAAADQRSCAGRRRSTWLRLIRSVAEISYTLMCKENSRWLRASI